LVSIVDPGHTGYQKLELWDSAGTLAGGEFIIGGVAQSGGHEIDVAPANVANTVFDAGTAGGTDTLWAQLQLNDGTVTGWQSFSVSSSKAAMEVVALETSLSPTGMTLTLDAPSTFNGQIIGFTGEGTLANSDQIDLRGLSY